MAFLVYFDDDELLEFMNQAESCQSPECDLIELQEMYYSGEYTLDEIRVYVQDKFKPTHLCFIKHTSRKLTS